MFILLYIFLVVTYWNKVPRIYDQTFGRKGYSLTTFGSKTGYFRNGLISSHKSEVEGMRLIHVNMFFRHGTRSPGKKFTAAAEVYKEQLERQHVNLSFSLASTVGGDKELLPAGFDELAYLGSTFAKIVPNSFRMTKNARVLSSPRSRALDSARAFVGQVMHPYV